VIDFAWIGDHLGAIAGKTGQHIELTVIALVVGFVLSFVLAIWSVNRPRVYFVVAGLSSTFYTIPSVAVFVTAVVLTGLSLFTIEIPLVMYTFVIYIRNIVAGLRATPPDVLEAADGMGFTPQQRLFRIQVPLAVPLIIAGTRLASVSTIGLVTITTLLGISFGGLGFFLTENPFFATEVIVGALGSIVLAVGADLAFSKLQERLTPWARVEKVIQVTPGIAPEVRTW
jgi:osmoprotectant transport system permease protein